MARRSLLLLSAVISLCVLPALATFSHGTPNNRPFRVKGRVYCDTCRAGFETLATTYIPGAKVRVECKDWKTLQRVYQVEAETDNTGTYELEVKEDHGDQMCECQLISSPLRSCREADPGRNRSTITLTRYQNGVLNDLCYANNMGFFREKALPGCTRLLKYYLQDEDQ